MATALIFVLILNVMSRIAQCHLGTTDMWEPTLEDPLSDARSVCGDVPTSCAEWREKLFSKNVSNSCCLPCDCEDDCEARKSCCYDYIHANSETSGLGAAFIYTEKNEKCMLPAKFGKKEGSEEPFYMWYLMIDDCPIDYSNITIVNGCNSHKAPDLSILTPAYSSKSKLSYVNRFCALCNQESDKDIIPWTMEINCDDFLFFPYFFPTSVKDLQGWLKHFFTLGVCSLYWQPPRPEIVQEKSCPSYSTKQECPVGMTSEALDRLCLQFPFLPIYGKYALYKNVFCMACSEHASTLHEYSELCKSSIQTTGYQTETAIRFNVDTNVIGSTESLHTEKCIRNLQEDEVSVMFS